MRTATGSSKRTESQWERLAQTKLEVTLQHAQTLPTLRKAGPRGKAPWQVQLVLLGGPAMARLNQKYRQKKGPTDVLSFPAPDVFRAQGLLGELVICLPVLKSQARALRHSQDRELAVLLVHGVLHLLGFDHELGEKEALLMERWERRLLRATTGSEKGLISRARG